MTIAMFLLVLTSILQEIRISILENKIENKFMELEHKNTGKNND